MQHWSPSNATGRNAAIAACRLMSVNLQGSSMNATLWSWTWTRMVRVSLSV